MRAVVLLVLLAGCPSSPTSTGAVCPDPDPMTLTWDSFGRDFTARYCTWCHDSDLTHSMRNGAPLYHDYNTLLGVLQTSDHVDEQSGSGPDATNELMPPERCPAVAGGPLTTSCATPTKEERKKLAEWIACERERLPR